MIKLFFSTEIQKIKLRILQDRIKRKLSREANRLKNLSLVNVYDFWKDGFQQAIRDMKESAEIEAESEIEKRFLALREKYLFEKSTKIAPTIEELLLLKDKLHDRFLEAQRTAEKYPDTKDKLISIQAQRTLIDRLIDRNTSDL